MASNKRPRRNYLMGSIEEKPTSDLIKDGDGTGLGKKKKPAEVYHYGRGGRQTTTDKSVADRGRFSSGYTAPSGKLGSIKAANVRKNRTQEETEKAIKETEEKKKKAFDRAFGR